MEAVIVTPLPSRRANSMSMRASRNLCGWCRERDTSTWIASPARSISRGSFRSLGSTWRSRTNHRAVMGDDAFLDRVYEMALEAERRGNLPIAALLAQGSRVISVGANETLTPVFHPGR